MKSILSLSVSLLVLIAGARAWAVEDTGDDLRRFFQADRAELPLCENSEDVRIPEAVRGQYIAHDMDFAVALDRKGAAHIYTRVQAANPEIADFSRTESGDADRCLFQSLKTLRDGSLQLSLSLEDGTGNVAVSDRQTRTFRLRFPARGGQPTIREVYSQAILALGFIPVVFGDGSATHRLEPIKYSVFQANDD